MVDVAALIIAVILFVILSPGLVLQIPGEERPVEFTNNRTSLSSIIVHAIVFCILFYLLQLAFGVHGGTKFCIWNDSANSNEIFRKGAEEACRKRSSKVGLKAKLVYE
ncbi:hypothetical protein Mapa_015661 [Marchantia paleacea]|nr:hypothetical protein Mapa_015661 [Marchantia paleacea]